MGIVEEGANDLLDEVDLFGWKERRVILIGGILDFSAIGGDVVGMGSVGTLGLDVLELVQSLGGILGHRYITGSPE